jgi:hypothetical protein
VSSGRLVRLHRQNKPRSHVSWYGMEGTALLHAHETSSQRSHWISIAREFPGTAIWVIVFDTPYDVSCNPLPPPRGRCCPPLIGDDSWLCRYYAPPPQMHPRFVRRGCGTVSRASFIAFSDTHISIISVGSREKPPNNNGRQSWDGCPLPLCVYHGAAPAS